MGSFVATSAKIFPTELDIKGSGPDGGGITHNEANLKQTWESFVNGGSFIISGFALPASGSLTQALPIGKAIIGSYYVDVLQTVNVSYDASQANIYVFLKVNFDGQSRAVSATIETNTTGIAPVNSAYIGRVGTDASAIINVNDSRTEGRHFWATAEYSTTGVSWKPLWISGNCYISGGGSGSVHLDFQVALLRMPRWVRAWKFPAAIGVSGDLPTELACKPVSTTRVTVFGTFTTGDIINVEVWA